jgi:hypothetical protein
VNRSFGSAVPFERAMLARRLRSTHHHRRIRPALAWVVTRVKQSGTLEGGVRYFKHGFGCGVWLPSGVVDFNFGAHGEIDQFDCHRLYYFARDRLAQYGFADEHGLKEAYRAAHQSGAIKYADTEYNAAVPPSAEDQDLVLTPADVMASAHKGAAESIAAPLPPAPRCPL